MRAQFYSLLALVIVIPIFVFTVNYLAYSQQYAYGVSDRVISDQLHQLVGSIELDTKKAMEISGRRALIAATNYVVDSGETLPQAIENITLLMTDGKLNGSDNFMMINNTIPDWSARIAEKPVNFDVTLQYSNLSISNVDGFTIGISLYLTMTVTDKLGIARIERETIRKETTVSVTGLEDPMFPLNTQGFIRRIIRRASPAHFTRDVVSGSQNTSGSCSGTITFDKGEDDDTKILVAENLSGVIFSRHLGIILEDNQNLSGDIACYNTGNSSAVELATDMNVSTGYGTVYMDGNSRVAWSMPGAQYLIERYYYHGDGPDFIGRLQGNYTPAANGMITLIYVPEMEEQAIEVEEYPRVAFKYFSRLDGCQTVRNTPDWFGIDSAYAAGINVSQLLTGDPCYTWVPGS